MSAALSAILTYAMIRVDVSSRPHALGAKPFYSVGEGVRGVTGKVTSQSRAVI